MLRHVRRRWRETHAALELLTASDVDAAREQTFTMAGRLALEVWSALRRFCQPRAARSKSFADATNSAAVANVGTTAVR